MTTITMTETRKELCILADLFAVIIKLNWDGNVMFALISKIISSSTAIIITVAIEWCWKYLGYRVSYLMSVCLLIFFYHSNMFFLSFRIWSSKEQWEFWNRKSSKLLNAEYSNRKYYFLFIKTNGTWREPPAIELITQIKVTAKAIK